MTREATQLRQMGLDRLRAVFGSLVELRRVRGPDA